MRRFGKGKEASGAKAQWMQRRMPKKLKQKSRKAPKSHGKVG